MRKKKSALRYSEEDDRTLVEDILDFVKVFAITAIVIMLFVNFVAHPVTVVGRSMHPTLQDGEYGFTSVISTFFKDPKRQQVVVVKHTDSDTQETSYWVKRIIGMPGDTIECHDETIYINGEALDESSYLDSEYVQSLIAQLGYFNSDFDAVTLGEDEYFVMGDNRPYSKDSRDPSVGTFTKSQIFGENVFVLFPFSQMGAH